MTESDETFKRLARMEKDLGDIEAMTRTLLRAQGNERRKDILDTMAHDEALRAVYLLVDGELGGSEIAEKLQGTCSKKTVERKLDELENEWGLIVFMQRRNPGGRVYRLSPIDKALGISRKLGS
jgi:DNA-binding transcriptional ArsR family regulator